MRSDLHSKGVAPSQIAKEGGCRVESLEIPSVKEGLQKIELDCRKQSKRRERLRLPKEGYLLRKGHRNC